VADLTQPEISERALVIAPGSAGEARDVIKLASAGGLAIIPAGGATFLDSGNVLDRSNLILTTRRLTKLVHHEPSDLVATAEAGLTLREFQQQLREQGQWLPIDPPDDGSATLGGVVATALAGPQKLGFGSLRSFVIGLRAILADGTAIKAGGRVVKNVAGYDLCKLFTGSYGTLGVITEVTFKLRPRPTERRTVVATGPLANLISIAQLLAHESFPVAVELLSASLAKQVNLDVKDRECALMVHFAGSSRAVVVETANALKQLREANIVCATYDEDEELWGKLSQAATARVNDLSWRATVQATDLGLFLEEVVALERDEASHVGLQWQAGAGDGRLRVMARAPAYHQESVRVLERLRQRAENRGGSLVIERAPVEIKQSIDSWGRFGSTTELMKRLKRQLDPDNILSPGRLFPV
jgi:FAD/FMN-containing dehydrogenase